MQAINEWQSVYTITLSVKNIDDEDLQIFN